MNNILYSTYDDWDGDYNILETNISCEGLVRDKPAERDRALGAALLAIARERALMEDWRGFASRAEWVSLGEVLTLILDALEAEQKGGDA